MRWALAAAMIGTTLIAPGTALAAITLGQLPAAPPTLGCFNEATVQVSVTSGPDYRVPPGGGVITRWDMLIGNLPQQVRLIIWDGDVSNNNIRAVAASDAVSLTPGALNTNPTRIPVAGGERLGLFGPAVYSCGVPSTNGPGDRVLHFAGAPPIGGPPGPATETVPQRIPLSAVLEPDADKDNFGDESQDSCPVESSIQVPCAAVIDKGPKKKTKSRKATFLFSVPAGAGISFECALDKNEFAPCESPHKLTKLKVRKHKFQVRAKDGAGQIGVVDLHRWRVIK